MKEHSPSEVIIGVTGMGVGWGVILLFVGWLLGYTLPLRLGVLLFALGIAPLCLAMAVELMRDLCVGVASLMTFIASRLTPVVEWLDSKPGRKSA